MNFKIDNIIVPQLNLFKSDGLILSVHVYYPRLFKNLCSAFLHILGQVIVLQRYH